jgi:predicted transcriptional regulator
MKLTQKELAKKAGVSQSLIARIEKRSIDPRLSTVKKILDVLTQTTEKSVVTDIMHSPVVTIDAKDSVRTAIDLMKEYNISQIPVLRENKIVGSIRESTIIDYITKKGNYEKVFSSSVNNIMEKRFAEVNTATVVDDVVLLFSQGEPAVLVVENNILLGIITKIDAISLTLDIKKDKK